MATVRCVVYTIWCNNRFFFCIICILDALCKQNVRVKDEKVLKCGWPCATKAPAAGVGFYMKWDALCRYYIWPDNNMNGRVKIYLFLLLIRGGKEGRTGC